mmetsp:Transcript_14334/g.39980  ORF Transcript_14334/g.39980 Transcript_14334/m.39980 type:complete len:287 (-) Transcript_14334:112-972(-)
MHFFRNKNRPRSSFELQVGSSHLLEVTVHLVTRRRDIAVRRRRNAEKDEWDWYDDNRKEIHQEFLELLEGSVLSRMFGDEIEDYHRKKNPSILPGKDEELIGKVGSKNRTSRTTNNARGKKRKGGAAVGKNTAAKNKKLRALIGKDDNQDEEKRPDKDIYFSFGELIQLAYRKEAIKDDRSSRTVLFQSLTSGESLEPKKGEPKKGGYKVESSKSEETATSTFRDRHKLSHRLLIWIGKSDAAASSEGGLSFSVTEGMYRPKMVPISSLFRKPAELMTLSDDDDED